MTDRSKDRLIRIAEVRHRTGLSTATIYRKMEDGSFPQRRKLSVHVVAWYEGDVDAWVAGFDQNAAA
jgi:prophage regulatory protein